MDFLCFYTKMLKIHKNPYGVMTNSPDFDYHRVNLSNYMGIGGETPENRLCKCELEIYSRGLGGFGLPGDFSSASRFVRACFVKENASADQTETASVNQFFHMLNAVAMPKGSVWTKNGFEYTRYSSCCNADKGIYYYTTYNQLGITAVSMQNVDLDQDCLYRYEVCGME